MGMPAIGLQYFGHWLLDGLPTCLLRNEDEILYLPVPDNWAHAHSYVDLLDLPRHNEKYVFFKEMAFYDDVGKNSHLGGRLGKLRKTLHTNVSTSGGHKVFLNRSVSGTSRSLLNEAEVINALQNDGFHIVSMDMSAREIAGVCKNASVIAGVEGSHLAHGILSAGPDTKFVVINPADRFNNVFVDYLSALGGSMGTIVAERHEDGYVLDPMCLIDFIRRVP